MKRMSFLCCLFFNAAVSAAVAPHPRLIADAGDFEALKVRLETTELGKLGRGRLLGEAEMLLGFPAPEYRKDESGRRILHISRAALDLIGKCAMAYRVTGEEKYARRAIREALDVSAFADWNPSHFLDTAEMALAVAICYDWLYDELSSAERDILADAILKKALTDGKGELSEGWWTFGGNNWNQVCNGGLVAAAIATAERHPDLTDRLVVRTTEGLKVAMAVFAPDGGFPEGPAAYWPYALEYNAIAIAAIEKYTGRPSPLCALPGFREQALFLDSCTGPTGEMFNFSDAGRLSKTERISEFASWWLAARFGMPETLVYREKSLLEKLCRSEIPKARTQRSYDRFFPFTLLCLRELPPTLTPNLPRCRLIGGTNPIAVMRTSWTDPDAWYVGIKGGSPSCSHGHMDLGSFVLDALGARWSTDLGNDNYAAVEKAKIDLWYMGQRSTRWSLFRYAPEGHSTVQVGDRRQVVAKKAEFTEFRPDFPAKATLDLSYAYDGLGKASRTFTLEEGGGLTITDTMDLEGDAPVTWRMNTRATARIDGNRAVLSQTDASGRLRELLVTTDAPDAHWEFRSVSEPRGPHDGANPGIGQLSFTVTPKHSGWIEWKVRFEQVH